MLHVYAIPVSLYCAKLRILLRHKGLSWEEVPPPGGYGSAEYRSIVPAGNLPALVDSDLLLADSEAIAEYLNEVHAEPPMLPRDPVARAKVRELSRYHDTRLEPAVRALFPFIAESARAGLQASQHEAVLQDRLAGLTLLLDSLPPQTSLVLADCGFPITLAWLSRLIPAMGLEIELPAPVTAYLERIRQHDAVAAELADYGAKLDDWLVLRVAG